MIACVGHWYVSLLYVAPVVLVVVGLKVASARAGDEDDDDTLPAEPLRPEVDQPRGASAHTLVS